MMKASVCMSTKDRPELLRNTLESICRQHPDFEFETIVVDDGSRNSGTRQVCEAFPQVTYIRREPLPGTCNPCCGRNAAYRAARGDVVICQSDEVIHVTEDCIQQLVDQLMPGWFIIANVMALSPAGKVWGEYTGMKRRKPFFFLGSVYRRDLYAVGGNDEEFAFGPAYDDVWFSDCLMNGRKLRPAYITSIVGHHQYHDIHGNQDKEPANKQIYERKFQDATNRRGEWVASGGPWEFAPCPDEDAEQVFTKYWQHRSFYDPKSGGDDESVSGAGSSLSATAVIRGNIPELIVNFGVETVLDAPCGDHHWMQHVDLSRIKYIGADIVRELIDENRKRYGSPGKKFLRLDIVSEDLPRADLVICRDGLTHLSQTDVLKFLQNFVLSGSKYLLATTFPGRVNQNIQTGQWAPYNLQAPPFNLPEPIEIINEGCREHYPMFKDKCMGLWSAESLVRYPIKSLVVCVDYDDFLKITLPRNAGHFIKTLVVTSTNDYRTQKVAESADCECYTTDVFYARGAHFNKGAAMEEGLDRLGRDGWICTWDCDIVMPRDITMLGLDRDCLYGPYRRILHDPKRFTDNLDWSQMPSPTHPSEYAGYFHLFHSSASSLRKLPWYSVDWVHAGGCDSDFQAKFPADNLKRTTFDVLHLGPEGIPERGTRVGRNWCGRVIPRIDGGRLHVNAIRNESAINKLLNQRRIYGTKMEKLQ